MAAFQVGYSDIERPAWKGSKPQDPRLMKLEDVESQAKRDGRSESGANESRPRCRSQVTGVGEFQVAWRSRIRVLNDVQM